MKFTGIYGGKKPLGERLSYIFLLLMTAYLLIHLSLWLFKTRPTGEVERVEMSSHYDDNRNDGGNYANSN